MSKVAKKSLLWSPSRVSDLLDKNCTMKVFKAVVRSDYW